MSKNVKEIIQIGKNYNIVIEESAVVINESGLDFQVAYVLDTDGVDWVFRLPRRDDVMPKTKVEKQALDLINQFAKIFEAPNWIIYTDELIAYKRLKGVPSGTIDHNIGNYVWELDINDVPQNYNITLGKVLAELHNIPSYKIIECDLEFHTPEDARVSMKRRMNEVKEKFGVNEQLWNRWQLWVNDDTLWPMKTGLAHGDLHAGHIMIDKFANVTGLIDWTEAKYTDVSIDFVFNYKVFGEKGLEDLINAYKDAGGYWWSKMKEHIIELDAAYPVAIAEFALTSNLEEYIQMAKESLGVKDN